MSGLIKLAAIVGVAYVLLRRTKPEAQTEAAPRVSAEPGQIIPFRSQDAYVQFMDQLTS